MGNQRSLQEKAAYIVRNIDKANVKASQSAYNMLLADLLNDIAKFNLDYMEIILRSYQSIKSFEMTYKVEEEILLEVAEEFNRSMIEQIDGFLEKITLMSNNLRHFAMKKSYEKQMGIERSSIQTAGNLDNKKNSIPTIKPYNINAMSPSYQILNSQKEMEDLRKSGVLENRKSGIFSNSRFSAMFSRKDSNKSIKVKKITPVENPENVYYADNTIRRNTNLSKKTLEPKKMQSSEICLEYNFHNENSGKDFDQENEERMSLNNAPSNLIREPSFFPNAIKNRHSLEVNKNDIAKKKMKVQNIQKTKPIANYKYLLDQLDDSKSHISFMTRNNDTEIIESGNNQRNSIFSR